MLLYKITLSNFETVVIKRCQAVNYTSQFYVFPSVQKPLSFTEKDFLYIPKR